MFNNSFNSTRVFKFVLRDERPNYYDPNLTIDAVKVMDRTNESSRDNHRTEQEGLGSLIPASKP